MQEEIQELFLLNQEINSAENIGDLDRLKEIINPFFAFRRRNGTIVNRDTFLQSPKPGSREMKIESIQIYGNRAVVTCVVTDSEVSTHNIRLFTKEEGNWKLLGWANEPT
jgi:hypothetical protein